MRERTDHGDGSLTGRPNRADDELLAVVVARVVDELQPDVLGVGWPVVMHRRLVLHLLATSTFMTAGHQHKPRFLRRRLLCEAQLVWQQLWATAAATRA